MNNEMIFCFVYRNMNVGGAELLIEKMANKLQVFGKKTFILCEKIDSVMENSLKNKNIEINKIKWKNLQRYIENFDTNENTLILIPMLWFDFVLCYSAKLKNKKTILYVVHFLTLAVTAKENGKEEKTDIFHKLMKKYISEIVSYSIKTGNILLMDEQTIESTKNYYSSLLRFSNDNFKLLRISIDTDGIKTVEKSQIIENLKHPKILTIARADFPFKAYLIGLVKWFIQYNNKDINLEIISYGPDINQLSDLINMQNKDIKECIHLIGKMDYSELDKYIKTAVVYVGMGTTLLDAAVRGVISIPVQSYIYEFKTTVSFDEDFRNLTADKCKLEDFSNQINKILSMKPDEYFELVQKNKNLVFENYSLDVNTKRLQNYAQKACFDFSSNHDAKKSLKKVSKLAGYVKFRSWLN